MKLEEYCRHLEHRVAELEKENAELRKRVGVADSIGIGVPSEKAMKQEVSEVPISLESEGTPTGIHKFSPPHE